MENPHPMLGGLRILIVEDEVMLAMLLEDMVLDFGCSVVEVVATVERALAAVLRNGLDGVLLDMNLRGQPTVAIAEELDRQSVPFLLVTGYSERSDDAPAIKAAPRLIKPFTVNDLAGAMTKAFVTAR